MPKIIDQKINHNGTDYFPLELALLKGENRAFKQLLLFGGNYFNFRIGLKEDIYSDRDHSSLHFSESGNILHVAVISNQISLLSHLLKWLFDNHNRNNKNCKKKEIAQINDNFYENENGKESTKTNKMGRNLKNHDVSGIHGIHSSCTNICTYSTLFGLLRGTDRSVRTPLVLAQDMKKV